MTCFSNSHQSLDAFQNEVLVRCPNCTACAVIRPLDQENPDWFAPRRLTCPTCGTVQDWADNLIRFYATEPVDVFFRYPLWLQIPCCNQILWANNSSHLDFLEMFVQAKLRVSPQNEQADQSNQSLTSRLPQWIQSRKNRDAILRAIAKLRASLPEWLSQAPC